MKIELTEKTKILLISLVIAGFLTSIGILSGDIGVLGNSVILSTFVLATPQLFLRYEQFRGLKEMEERMPLFLRDMAESIRAGMAPHKALIASSKVDYGKLSKEINKTANQISWGVPLEQGLDQFAERVKTSRRLYVAIKIAREAHISGGDMTSVLESVADNASVLEDAEKERKSLLSQYVLIMYAISIIFVAIVAAINNLLIPIFKITGSEAGGEMLGLSNPCDMCMPGIECSVCAGFELVSRDVFSIKPEPYGFTIGAYYAALFFFMSLTQSIFSGLVVGQISENSAIAGIKHSLIMAGITFGAFSILVRLGFIGG